MMVVSLAGSPLACADITRQALRNAADYSANHRGFSLLVIQHGKTLLEEYSNGGNARARHPIYSGTKSFFTIAALVAEKDGLLRLDEPVAETLTEWHGDAWRHQITLRELMNFTDGLDPVFRLHSNKISDRNSMAIQTPMVASIGKSFTYGPSHGQILCEVLRRKLSASGQSPFGFLQSRVLEPIGLSDVPHRIDEKGNPLVASGIRLTAREWSKFGLLVLGRGSMGRRVIVPEKAFSQCFVGTRINPMFGLGFWLNTAANNSIARETDIEKMLELKWQDQDWRQRCICRSAPADLVALVGSGYQRLFIIPSLDLLIVRQGEDAKFSDAEFLRKFFTK